MNILNNYLTERFGYDPKIDSEEYANAKATMDSFDFSVIFEANKERNRIIKENIDYTFLIPDERFKDDDADKEISPIMFMFYWGIDDSKLGLRNLIEKVINNLTAAEIKELNRYNYVGLNILELEFLYLGAFSSIYNFNYEYGYDNDPLSVKLKDPFYKLPELDVINNIKSNFGLSSAQVVSLLGDQVHDYATYNIGDYNADEREEFLMYWDDILRPAILSDKKDINIDSKIKILKGYLRDLVDVKREERFIELARKNKDYTADLNGVLIRFRHFNERKLKDIPLKYRKEETIQKEIDKLSTS